MNDKSLVTEVRWEISVNLSLCKKLSLAGDHRILSMLMRGGRRFNVGPCYSVITFGGKLNSNSGNFALTARHLFVYLLGI